ncbi:MAG: cation diffusion facilitator family transporter [Acetatifactor sp.]
MITLLSNLFIKNKSEMKNPTVRQAYGMLCGGVGIFLNLMLFAGKFLAGLLSSSIAITADAFNNLSDAGSSIITLLGFKIAGQKPDPEHPFGHGRVEYISGLGVSVLILLMGIELVKGSVSKIIHPEELTFSPVIIVILLASILVKCYMFYYNRTLGKKLDSAAMSATAMDSISDCLATTVVLIATLVGHFTSITIDGWCGLLVGLFICRAGIMAAKETIGPLLGQPPSPEFVEQVSNIVMSYEEVIGLHDLIVHDYGPGRVLISLHAEVPADGNILTLHDVIDTIEQELKTTLNCHAVIHMDPVQVGDEETDRLKAMVKDIIAQIDSSLTIHDFRIVTGPTHTNLIFDVVTPFDFRLTDSELTALIQEKVKQENPGYFTVIQVDKRMS